jgi:hypothetical protein
VDWLSLCDDDYGLVTENTSKSRKDLSGLFFLFKFVISH